MEGGTYSQTILEEFSKLANENLKVQTKKLYEKYEMFYGSAMALPLHLLTLTYDSSV